MSSVTEFAQPERPAPHTIVPIGEHLVALFNECFHCATLSALVLQAADYDRWTAGEMCQNVWPDVDNAEREQFFLSGLCGTCFDKQVVGLVNE